MPVIDYTSHPGFLSAARHTTFDDRRVASALERIDAVFDATIESGSPDAAADWAEAVHDAFSDLVDCTKAACDSDPGVTARVHKALIQAQKELGSIVQYRCQPHDGMTPADSVSTEIQSQIAVDGIAVTHVRDGVIAAIRDHLKHHIAEVRQMAERNPADRRSLPLQMAGKAWDILWAALNEVGIVGGVSVHEGHEVRPMNWSLMQNSPSERWYKDCYADVDIETSPLAYMHYDHDCNYAKIQVYLSDVDRDSAPFSYVPGSHSWTGSPTQQMIFKTLDMAFADLPKPAGDVYYRARFKHHEYRRQFLMLPREFQGTSHFGDDVLPDSDLGRELTERERFVTSDLGNCMVFTGGKALHRGGMARSKERLVLQVGVAAVPPVSWSLEKKTVKQAAAERVGRFLRATIGDAATEAVGRQLRRLGG
jgi:hypothetical protein